MGREMGCSQAQGSWSTLAQPITCWAAGDAVSSFEYTSVLLSIVLALGIAHILSGVTALIERWDRLERYWVFLAWCILMLAFHLGFWVNLWRFQARPEWTGGDLTYWFVSVALLFVASRLLVPAASISSSMRQHFAVIRRPFFGAVTLYWLIAAMGPLFLDTPWIAPRRLGLAGFVLLSLSGALVSSERYHSGLVVVWALLYAVVLFFLQAPIS